jgi:N-acetylmuramoyl-L-alanine amidase
MRVKVDQRFVPANHEIRSHLPMTPRYTTIHETANRAPGADAEMHARYMLTQDAISREVLWHFTVDSNRVIQHLPTNEVGWHAGDGYNGVGNRQSIAIELCVNADGDFEATQRLAAKLVADLIESTPSLAPFPDCVVQHNRWSGKNCPTIIRSTPDGWSRFLSMVSDELRPASPFNDVPADAWYAQDLAELKAKGYVKGDVNGNLAMSDEAVRLLVVMNRIRKDLAK